MPPPTPSEQPRGGPGSVMVSESDLSSPLNYGTPSSVGSSLRTPRTGTRGTPIRGRSDIQSDRRIRQVPVGGSQGDAMAALPPSSEIVPPSENSESAPTMVIWGTDVSVNQCKSKFKKFISNYVDAEAADDERFAGMDPNAPFYLQRLEEINTLEEPFLPVNCGHVQQFDEDLYRQLVCYPLEEINTLEE